MTLDDIFVARVRDAMSSLYILRVAEGTKEDACLSITLELSDGGVSRRLRLNDRYGYQYIDDCDLTPEVWKRVQRALVSKNNKWVVDEMSA